MGGDSNRSKGDVDVVRDGNCAHVDVRYEILIVCGRERESGGGSERESGGNSEKVEILGPGGGRD